MVLRPAPTRSVFLRPRYSPKRAVNRQPSRLPSYFIVSVNDVLRRSRFPYREAACCYALDVGILGLRKGLDEVWTDQDSTDDTLLHD